jgi:ketosteroid isomerase-like protein
VVRESWRLMASNDFDSVAAVMAADVVVEWPQSRERIRGPSNVARVNAEYPSAGPWRFTIERLVADGAEVVTKVRVTDGTLVAPCRRFARRVAVVGCALAHRRFSPPKAVR